MKRKTNVEMVTDYMEFGNGLSQAFVVEAISRYANECLNQRSTLIEKMKNSVVSGEAWLQCASDWKDLIANDPRK